MCIASTPSQGQKRANFTNLQKTKTKTKENREPNRKLSQGNKQGVRGKERLLTN